MYKYVIKGEKKLKGEVQISGSKNASLPIMAASLLTPERVIVHNVPDLMDIKTMISLLEYLGKKVEFSEGKLIIDEVNDSLFEAPYDIVRKMRASIAVLGPLLGRKKKARVSFPGGCAIGPRPVDIHIRGMKALGAEINIIHGYIDATAKVLQGKTINLLGTNGPSVLATENVMMAATLAEGITVIEGAACEPEVEDLANFLNSMGARITGAGTPFIKIEGVSHLHSSEYKVIPDRIEAGTFIAMAGITLGELKIKNVNVKHIEYPIDVFSRAGVEIEIIDNSTIIAIGKNIKPVEVETLPFPFFPTDLQSQLMALVSISDGISIITEKIFTDRFLHAAELNRMGANIKVDGATAIIKGVPFLTGASVMTSDLRAGAGLVMAALAAKETSEVLRIYHIDRGYEKLEEKIRKIGGYIERVPQ